MPQCDSVGCLSSQEELMLWLVRKGGVSHAPHTKEYQVVLFAPGGQMQWQGNEGKVNIWNWGEQQLSKPVALLYMGKSQILIYLGLHKGQWQQGKW